MIKKLDARGLSCPQPVLQTKNALDELTEDILEVTVDNAIAMDNIKRFAESSGCLVDVEETAGEYRLTIQKMEGIELNKNKNQGGKLVFIIGTNVLGQGDRKLGETLMEAFMYTLVDSAPKTEKIILLNEGVKLAIEGAPVVEALEVLQNKGVAIFSCGTCLNFFQIKDKLKVGTITNMMEIVESITNSDKVIWI